ncbi:ATP-binding cassette domain-containing protein [Candidatus Pantoea edessiphila]|nr:ATP-binding cassette domain-containing protein [Candidatus Pantoea edessiphila]
MAILKAENLTKTYQGLNIIDNISLNIRSGEIVRLLGSHGSGKTTVCYMLMGITTIDKGKITIDNHDIGESSLYNRTRLGMGYLPKNPSIFRQLSVYDNIMSILQIREDIKEGEHKNYAAKLIKKFKIDFLSKKMGHELIGSNRRIVEIARALASNPKFIVIDEPFANIDINSANHVKKILNCAINMGIGILITDNNFNDTLEFCKRTYTIKAGRIDNNIRS